MCEGMMGQALEIHRPPSGFPILTRLVSSKRAEKWAYIQRSNARETASMPLVTRTPVAWRLALRLNQQSLCLARVGVFTLNAKSCGQTAQLR